MRPGQVELDAQPVNGDVRLDVSCPNCGSPWTADASACGNCGWHVTQAEEQQTIAPCSLCHQSRYVDSLSKRCTRCHPIQINDVAPELQDYARGALSKRLREFTVGMLVGPSIVGI